MFLNRSISTIASRERPLLVPRAIQLAIELLQDHPTIPETREVIHRRLKLQRFLRLEQAAQKIEHSGTGPQPRAKLARRRMAW